MTADVSSAEGLSLEEVRLTAFKSFHGQVLRLAPLTILIGRNSSGKSNALDAIEVLSRLAHGEDIRDALEGRRRDADPVRGGLEGCAPHGEDVFALGCTVATPQGPVSLDVVVRVRPEVQIISETLVGPVGGKQRTLLETAPADDSRGDIQACWYNGKRGRSPYEPFRSSRLLTGQLVIRAVGTTAGERATITAAEQLLTVLRGVFQLDPVPHLMRQYVAARDYHLRRTAENLSAAVGYLRQKDRRRFRRLLELMRGLSDHDVHKLTVSSSDLGDVMLALDEGRSGLTPAREMSDGMLRFLAVCTAVLSGGAGLDLGPDDDPEMTRTLMLVVEELENGLHPSQAATVLQLVKQASRESNTQVLITTHSPALLSALDGSDHQGVVVCSRNSTDGHSRLLPLTELDGYAAAMATGPLGDVVTRGNLPLEPKGDRDFSAFDRLLGIG
ncbi:putative ATPase [Streptomyces sp. T12]|uniref:AAA family ATPase n=1 Tax=Streptomyces sp. T12 TaxID=477697 RepID=UPI0011AAF363|nr:ATP-binding protein [Streptomyces sp. T12]TWD21660.1 putative ATPase [Streptomyces sp. T12]